MRCLMCSEVMKLVRVEPHEVIDLAGFERHTYECTACHETEERLVFNRAGSRAETDGVAAEEVTGSVSTVPAASHAEVKPAAGQAAEPVSTVPEPSPSGAPDAVDKDNLKRLLRKIKISISRS